jgi:hypothetical protein
MFRALALTVVAVALSGCGGDDEAEAQRCRAEAERAAEAAVVARLYEQGRLGPKAEVRRELESTQIDDGGLLVFFDEDGHMLPWAELDDDERNALAFWWSNDPEIYERTFEAREQARENVDPDC